MHNMRLLLGCGLVLIAMVLHGCGGGGDSPSPTPAPPGPGPTPPPYVPKYGASVKVVTYNLFWWCVSGNPQHVPEKHRENCGRYVNNKGFELLYKKITDQGPFDLIGFQEVVNLEQVIEGAGLKDTFESYAAPPQYGGVHDSGMAWSKAKFETLAPANASLVCTDQYGPRYISYVRLKVKGSTNTVFYANTHGPLTHCDRDAGKLLAKNYLDTIHKYRQPEDSVIFTGDFNCLPTQTSMKLIMENFTTIHDHTMKYDNIVRSNWVRMDKNYTAYAPPSDHSIITADLSLPNWDDGHVVPDPPPAPSPALPATTVI